ncbi:hypothetical protein AWH62_10555 [Maricaulis sp. W15]|uniref:DUF938 domain-containing protein n=1 Tax=Maricaulis sp. W15 TaxID=1772333 RepID=UPI000948FB6F|nr:DUF938 domain-containing protein [Maricaulis sp. W15]OLF72269.1 hypothetical protein AWH62_10555 [Maricaulis sp. W15]
MSKPPGSPIALEQRTATDDRLHSPSAARNRDAIAAVLADVLPPDAEVLEIGSGTGEHALAACRARPDIRWQPSDPDPASRASQAAWASEADGAIRPPLAIDLMDPQTVADLAPFDALVCMNVIHISPWGVAEALAALAGRALRPGGCVMLYGPFMDGEATAPSNRQFDASLKARNPAWGVRALDDVVALMAGHGLALDQQIAMPANNLSLVFKPSEPR